jgi:hypothetical protein
MGNNNTANGLNALSNNTIGTNNIALGVSAGINLTKGATISISVMQASVASPRQLNPDLVVRDRDGKVYTVRYEAVDAMSLNEFLKEHRKLEQQAADITQLKWTVKVLTASLKEQAS